MWWQPFVLASSALSFEPTVPITVAPRCFAHWQRIRPTPPAAAWMSTVLPFSTLKVRSQQILRRHALEHHAGGLLVADIGRQLHGAVGRQHCARPHSRRAAKTAATRSPTLMSVTPGPTAITSPAPSLPAMNGIAAGGG